MASKAMHTKHKTYISIKWCNNNHDQLYVMFLKRSIKKQYHKPILKPHICFHFISFESLRSVLLKLLVFYIENFFFRSIFHISVLDFYHVIVQNRWSWTKAIIIIITQQKTYSTILITSLIEYKNSKYRKLEMMNF